MAFANAGSWRKAEFATYYSEVAFQQVDLAFAARAPPYMAANVAITGAYVHENGHVRALEGTRSADAPILIGV